jgi:hypothetical protein
MRFNPPAPTVFALMLASAVLAGAGHAEEPVDPSLVDLQGLEALRSLETGDADAEDEAETDLKGAEARVQTLLDEQLRLQADLRDGADATAAGPGVLGEASPRMAQGPPEERELPIAIFDTEEVTVPAGTWGNSGRLKLVKQTLDADGNGKPELVRWIDPESKLQIRREEDRNYDGVTDAWSDYEWGRLVARVLDSNDDGNPDVWEHYAKGAQGRMTTLEIDRDDDGVRDAFYRFEGDSLAEERHDSNNDGRIDLQILYQNRLRMSAEEDQNKDGRMDTWTTYVSVNGSEVIERIERDERGDGEVDVVELFDTKTGEAVLSRKDEDVNGDGEVDVVSIYEGGRLVRREISDASLVEL